MLLCNKSGSEHVAGQCFRSNAIILLKYYDGEALGGANRRMTAMIYPLNGR